MALSSFVLVIGFCLLDFQNLGSRNQMLNAVENSDTDIFWNDVHAGSFASVEGENTYYINTAGQLAYMNYCLSNDTSRIFDGATFILENDIKMDHVYIQRLDKEVTPFWTPIEIGQDYNITFNGNGNTISGLNIKCNSDAPRNVGFFADMVGGVFENVTIEAPKITYEYHGTSFAVTDPLRPDAPVEVCLGVIAGSADSTYINNVNIVNPTVKFTSENLNGHSFYVGGAVGKLTFTSTLDADGKTIHSTNTVTPTKWGLDTIKLIKNETATGITMRINAGAEDGVTYGDATNVYFGGLAGAIISSKIINSTLHDYTAQDNDYTINPDFDTDLLGNYFVGGLAGLTTQIAAKKELIVATGLYNNLLLDVKLNDTHNHVETYYGGNLTGRIYSGGWVYNNMIIGAMPYDLWGQVYNTKNRLVTDAECIGNINGSIDEYFLNDYVHNDAYPNCQFGHTTLENGETYYYCSKHATSEISLHESGRQNIMKNYNFYYQSLEDPEYVKLLNDTIEVQIDENNSEVYSKFDLLNNFNHSEGYMYYATIPIVEYEVGLTVNEINPDTDEIADMEERRLDAIYQFRTWSYDSNKEPYLKGYFGLDYSVTFVSNSPHNSDAYWIKNGEKIYELNVGRTYQQIIYNPEESPKEPKLNCEGYELEGWRIEGLELGSDEIKALQAKGYVDDSGYYIFDRERIIESNRRFVADWGEPIIRTVSYIIREDNLKDQFYDNESVTFGQPLMGPTKQPTSNQGLSFVGWFLEKDLPADGKDADPNKQWKFGLKDGDPMPGRDINLYTGWINNFTMLNLLLDNEQYKTYYENYKNYFSDDIGNAFGTAYQRAWQARHDNDFSNIGSLLVNLQETYRNLRVDPDKLLNLAAFDESRIENSCQFLYNSDARISYNTYKDTVRKYIVSAKADEEMLTDIEGFILHYNKLETLVHEMKDNLHESVAAIGGIESVEITDLIEKHQNLQNRYANLVRDNYKVDSLEILDAAENKMQKLWAGEGDSIDGPHLSDVKGSIRALENAFDTLQTKDSIGGDNTGNNTTNHGNTAQPISPVVVGISIVLVMLVGAGGYIGVDVVLYKRRIGSNGITNLETTKTTELKNTENSKSQKTEISVEADDDDDETYI